MLSTDPLTQGRRAFGLEALTLLAVVTFSVSLLSTLGLMLLQTCLGILGMIVVCGFHPQPLLRAAKVATIIPFCVFLSSVGWTALAGVVRDGVLPTDLPGARGLALALRLGCVIACSVYYVSTLDPEELATRLTDLGVSFRLVHSLSLMYLAGAILIGEIQQRAMAFRLRFASSPELMEWVKYRIEDPVHVTLDMLDQTDAMAFALESRGFSSGRAPMSLWRYRVSVPIVVTAVVACLASVALLVVEYL